MKVNVTNAGEERGVFDLTNRDSKTLQLALLLAVSCHCTVPCKRLSSPPAALHLLKAELLPICGERIYVTNLSEKIYNNPDNFIQNAPTVEKFKFFAIWFWPELLFISIRLFSPKVIYQPGLCY